MQFWGGYYCNLRPVSLYDKLRKRDWITTPQRKSTQGCLPSYVGSFTTHQSDINPFLANGNLQLHPDHLVRLPSRLTAHGLCHLLMHIRRNCAQVEVYRHLLA